MQTSADVTACMADLASDLLGDRIETRRATAVVGATRVMLATVLAEYKYGYPAIKGQGPKARTLQLNS